MPSSALQVHQLYKFYVDIISQLLYQMFHVTSDKEFSALHTKPWSQRRADTFLTDIMFPPMRSLIHMIQLHQKTYNSLNDSKIYNNFWPIFWLIPLHTKFFDSYSNILNDVSVVYICLSGKLFRPCKHFDDCLVIANGFPIGAEYVTTVYLKSKL